MPRPNKPTKPAPDGWTYFYLEEHGWLGRAPNGYLYVLEWLLEERTLYLKIPPTADHINVTIVRTPIDGSS